MNSEGPMNEICPPVLPHGQAALYIGRTPRALYALNDRREGPSSFKVAGRRMYRVAALDAWLATAETRDSRSNPDLDPTRRAPEPRAGRRRVPRHGEAG